MNAQEAATLTESADLRVLFLQKANARMADIKRRIEGRARQGFGSLPCEWIESASDGLFGKALEEVIVRKLREDGYDVSKRPHGAPSYSIRWCDDKKENSEPCRLMLAEMVQS